MRADILELIGTLYRYGVEVDLKKWPPKLLDCSECMEILFTRRCISCPDGSLNQHAASVSISNPRPGDLGFFADPKKVTASNPYGIYHVGMIFSDTQMVEARAKDKKGRYGKVIYRPRSAWEKYAPFKKAGGYRRLKASI